MITHSRNCKKGSKVLTQNSYTTKNRIYSCEKQQQQQSARQKNNEHNLSLSLVVVAIVIVIVIVDRLNQKTIMKWLINISTTVNEKRKKQDPK